MARHLVHSGAGIMSAVRHTAPADRPARVERSGEGDPGRGQGRSSGRDGPGSSIPARTIPGPRGTVYPPPKVDRQGVRPVLRAPSYDRYTPPSSAAVPPPPTFSSMPGSHVPRADLLPWDFVWDQNRSPLTVRAERLRSRGRFTTPSLIHPGRGGARNLRDLRCGSVPAGRRRRRKMVVRPRVPAT